MTSFLFKTYSNNLPQQAQHKMWFSSVQIFRPDVDDITTDGAGRVESEGEVFVYLIDAQLSPVNRTFVNSVRAGTVDEFAAK